MPPKRKKPMRLPNSFGTISKLSGARRKPWMAKKFLRYKLNEQTGRMISDYLIIGYYETYELAYESLLDYNRNPYSVMRDATFKDVYDSWSNGKFDKISESNAKGYKASYSLCNDIENKVFVDIKLADLQYIVDTCGKNYPTLRKLKVLFGQMYDYAIKNDIASKNYSEYVDISGGNKDSMGKREPFSQKEISILWDNVYRNRYMQIPLMLIYSGVRISELLDLKKEDIHLNERYFDVVSSKTDAGIRKVPIAEKVYKFYEEWFNHSKCQYLLCTENNKRLLYRNYYDAYWTPVMKELVMQHRPHDTRHTCISLLASAEISQTIIKTIVGHSGAMTLTERVYTHLEIEKLVEAINKI